MRVPRRLVCPVISIAIFLGALSPAVAAAQGSSGGSVQSQINRLQSDEDFLRVLVFVLLGGGFAIGLVVTIRTERRSTELHHLAVAGESAAQDRAEQVHTTFLDASRQTLALVNETLSLAKDASQRAEEALERRADRVRNEVESEARLVIGPLIVRPDLHSIVKDQERRLEIVDLARKIERVQGYLELEEIVLSADCHFVLGLNAHFEGNSRAAIKYLDVAATASLRGDDLEIASLYWRAYELNNTGEYRQARDLFRKAGDRDGTRHSERFYELERMWYETRFLMLADAYFHSKTRHSETAVHDLYHDIEQVKKGMPRQSEYQLARAHLDQTQAHLLIWAAEPPKFAGTPNAEQRQLLERAYRQFDEALELERAPELWTMLGRAEAGFHLGRKFDGSGYRSVLKLTRRELDTRVERRSLVSLEQARLIAQVRLQLPEAEVEQTNERLRDYLKSLDDHMHIFSHFQKCNLPRVEFRNELNGFWEEYEEDLKRRSKTKK